MTITKSQLAEDTKRGYRVTPWQPSGVQRTRDRETGKVTEVPVPTIPNYTCMECQFSSTDENKIKEHVFRMDHPYSFGTNEYGEAMGPYGLEHEVEVVEG